MYCEANFKISVSVVNRISETGQISVSAPKKWYRSVSRHDYQLVSRHDYHRTRLFEFMQKRKDRLLWRVFVVFPLTNCSR